MDSKEERSERIAQRPRPGATRCPFCHEECAAEADACACADCLSRHHTGCWNELGECASCRSPRRLQVLPAATDPPGYGEAIEAWLRFALVYNGGLALLTLSLLGSRLLEPPVVAQVGFGAVLANVSFLLGPACELVFRRFGYRGVLLRWLLFVAGFAIALLLGFVSCLMLPP